jgi:predicted Zn-dependent protease
VIVGRGGLVLPRLSALQVPKELHMPRWLCWMGIVFTLAVPAASRAEPLHPRSDDEVVETVPAMPGRAVLARAAASPRVATEAARALIEEARATGDPRPVGRAMALLQPWVEQTTADPQAVLMMATAEQYVHDFDRSIERLQRLSVRAPSLPQVWLTLATLQRLKGRYSESDRDCARLMALGASLHGQACLAENAALRGDVAGARATLQRLLSATADRSSRNWLLTTLAEAEERAGRVAEAESAYRAALAAEPGGYAAIACADFLIRQGRGAEARAVLQGEPHSDAVLLRLALADPADALGRRAATELRDRFAQAAERPGAAAVHSRERAMYLLHVAHDAHAALAMARLDLKLQREPADLLVMAEAAKAAGDASARQELRRLTEEMDLHDERIAALL